MPLALPPDSQSSSPILSRSPGSQDAIKRFREEAAAVALRESAIPWTDIHKFLDIPKDRIYEAFQLLKEGSLGEHIVHDRLLDFKKRGSTIISNEHLRDVMSVIRGVGRFMSSHPWKIQVEWTESNMYDLMRAFIIQIEQNPFPAFPDLGRELRRKLMAVSYPAS